VLPKIYIETSVIGYLTARPSRDALARAHQDLTRDWWEYRLNQFEIFVSEVVLDEIARGDATAARARVAVVERYPILRVSDSARNLAAAILSSAALPAKAAADALHISIAAVNGMDFLLTWNCTHIANGIILRAVGKISRELGFEPPIVCTPEELMAG